MGSLYNSQGRFPSPGTNNISRTWSLGGRLIALYAVWQLPHQHPQNQQQYLQHMQYPVAPQSLPFLQIVQFQWIPILAHSQMPQQSASQRPSVPLRQQEIQPQYYALRQQGPPKQKFYAQSQQPVGAAPANPYWKTEKYSNGEPRRRINHPVYAVTFTNEFKMSGPIIEVQDSVAQSQIHCDITFDHDKPKRFLKLLFYPVFDHVINVYTFASTERSNISVI